MSIFSSPIDRIESLRRRVERSSSPTRDLLSDIVAATCPAALADADRPCRLVERWLAEGAFTQIAFALVEARLPDWSVRRLCQEGQLWWCAITHRDMIEWGGEEEDESHEDMTLALLKSYLTVLCHLPDDDHAPPPTRRRMVPIAPQGVSARAAPNGVGLYEILIKTLGATSRSFMQQVK